MTEWIRYRLFQLKLRLTGLFVCPRRGHDEMRVVGHEVGKVTIQRACRRCGRKLGVEVHEGRYPLPREPVRVVL